jgi:hypothetical protein
MCNGHYYPTDTSARSGVTVMPRPLAKANGFILAWGPLTGAVLSQLASSGPASCRLQVAPLVSPTRGTDVQCALRHVQHIILHPMPVI